MSLFPYFSLFFSFFSVFYTPDCPSLVMCSKSMIVHDYILWCGGGDHGVGVVEGGIAGGGVASRSE